MSPICLWPYAVKAVIHWEWWLGTLRIWVTFRHPMNTSVLPPLASWVISAPGAGVTPSSSVWRDAYTIMLGRSGVAVNPGRCQLAYNGPDENLRTTWDKQWEPFAKIVGIEVPYDWRDVLDVDTVNKLVTINGALVFASITLTAGLGQNPDISKVNIVFCDCSAGDISISAFIGGITGQIAHIARLCAAVNDVTLIHRIGPPNQLLNLHAGANETLTGEYGGWTLVCNGSQWYDVSHAKHV